MTLAPWLTALPVAEEMREVDRWAIEQRDVPSLDLMERAGEGLARLAEEVAPDGPVAVVCGPGNNGGDGYVAARLLRWAGREVKVLAVGELRGPDALANRDRLPGDGPEPMRPGALAGAVLIVDALLGTGSSGEPRGEFAEAIEAINASPAPAVAADVPSGVDASTGEVAGGAVVAVATATFASAKPGLWVQPGKAHAGRVVVVDIGIPRGAPIVPAIGLIGDDVAAVLPLRGATANKHSSGNVMIAGGSRGLTGAVCLAAAAAARAGAGYVTACVPGSLEAIFEVKLTEAMTVALADDGGRLVAAAADGLLERAVRGALVVGPGLGTDSSEIDFAYRSAIGAMLPLVLDAGGLTAFSGRLAELRGRAAPTILTPHQGELARLLELDHEAVAAARLRVAREAAGESGAIVVLKGDDTIVAEPDGRIAISPGNAPGLATAGTGDVLSGVIGAFLARGAEPFEAACAAVRVHLQAGRRAADAVGAAEGVVAGDVVQELPRAAAELRGARL